jgi:DNA-binding transcriptional regulator YhcF (GntR family)
MIVIDLQSPIPLEEQIRRAIRWKIATGELCNRDPLPSVRQLAGDLGVHWNTVARAYRRLQDEGLLTVGRGRGVFVKTRIPSQAPPDPGVREYLAAKLREIFTDARLMGLPDADLHVLVREELEGWSPKEKYP